MTNPDLVSNGDIVNSVVSAVSGIVITSGLFYKKLFGSKSNGSSKSDGANEFIMTNITEIKTSMIDLTKQFTLINNSFINFSATLTERSKNTLDYVDRLETNLEKHKQEVDNLRDDLNKKLVPQG